MRRDVRYAKSGGGVRIAAWVLGEGEPLVYLTGSPVNHVELWGAEPCFVWYELLTRRRALYRYDPRGVGLSSRQASDLSFEAHLADLDAVIDMFGLRRLHLFGAADGGAVALAYAAHNPDRVASVALWCAITHGGALESPRLAAWRSLLDQDWALMTETCAHLVFGWSAGELGREAARLLRENVTPEALRAAFEANRRVDVRPLLASIQTPVLVMQRTGIPWFPTTVARDLTSAIPGARLQLFAGESPVPYVGEMAPVATAVHAFLDESPIHEDDRADATPLSPREREVLKHLAAGASNKEIAAALYLSVRTVERHVGNIYKKVGLRSRVQAAAYAVEHKLD